MANQDTQNRINALKQEEVLQNNIAAALKKNLDYRTKQGKVARDLAKSLTDQEGTEAKLNSVLQAKQELLEGQYNLSEDRAKQLLKELEGTEELLRKEQKREQKSAQIKDLQEDLKSTLLDQVGLGGELGKSLLAGAGAAAGLIILKNVVTYLGDAVKRSIELSKQTGMTAGQIAEYEGNLLKAKFSAQGFLYDMDDLRASAEATRNLTGSIKINPDTVNSITALSKLLGDAGAAASLARTFESISEDSDALRESIKEIANKSGVDAKVAFEALADNELRLLNMSEDEVKVLAQQAAQMKQMGIDRKKSLDLAGQALDIETSLANQMKLQQVTGQNLTSEFEALRAAQASGDEEATSRARLALAQKLQSVDMSNLQVQRIIAETTGIEADELVNIINSKNESAKLSEKIADAQSEETEGLSANTMLALKWSGYIALAVGAFILLKKLKIGSMFSELGKGMGRGLMSASVGLASLANPATLLGLGALTVAIIGIGFALKLAAPGIKAFGVALGTIIKSLGSALSNIITSIGDVFVKVAQIATPQMALSLMGMAAGFAALSASLATFAVAGLAAIPSMIAVGTFASIGGAELLGGGEDNSNEELVNEIKGLRSDIQSQPILISVDGKVVSEITKAQSRQKSFSRQMGR